jgi:glutathione peroxidase
MRELRVLPVFVAALALGCSSSSSDPTSTGGQTPAPAATYKPPPTGQAATVDPLTDPNAPPCSGTSGELYGLSATTLGGVNVPLCRAVGKVLMFVNTASHCGYTPQYAPLQAIYQKYTAQGFYVLGFPSGSFNQESATAAEVTSFCTSTYNITFPMFAIGNVNMPDEQPVWTWLKSQPGFGGDVAWNFEKFLVNRHGKVVKRILTATTPDDPEVTAAIEAELAKP